MKTHFRFVMAQLDFLVGDIEGNAQKIIQAALCARDEHHANLIVFPELCLTGYPAEDLLYRDNLYKRIAVALETIQTHARNIDLLIGYPIKEGKKLYNAAGLIRDGKTLATYSKICLPNYSVFDEARYFKPGKSPLVVDYDGLPLGVVICEDLWHEEPLQQTVAAGAKLVISINASPFDMRKHEARSNMLRQRAKDGQVPILYVNCIGAQDELVFDGGSLVLDEKGMVELCGPFYEESLIPVDIEYDTQTQQVFLHKQLTLPVLSKEERVYKALTLGIQDYIEKNHFSQAIIGLSGGIDSALTLAITVDAIGPERVLGVLMSSRYTTQQSVDDALESARLLNVKTIQLSIDPIFSEFLNTLAHEFEELPPDVTEENLQARSRGTLLMALSNKKGGIVIATGNKSEISVGYSTLYGDMVGGFCALKDIPKTLVYRLAEHRNRQSRVIPESTIQRAPTAELNFNQKDQDTLPPYPILDQILELYVEQDLCLDEIAARGFDEVLVRKIILMVDRNEYKRRQSAPGVRITTRAFGRDRRYPITSGYNRIWRQKN